MKRNDEHRDRSIELGGLEDRKQRLPEFGLAYELDAEIGFAVGGSALRDAIRQTIFAICPDAAAPVLGGALFELGDERLRIVTTDTHRLCLRRVETLACEGAQSVIVPGHDLNTLLEMLIDDVEAVVASISRAGIGFRIGTRSLSSKPIEGQFPKYEQVFPDHWSTRLIVPTHEFLMSVTRICSRLTPDSPRVELRTEGKRLWLTAADGRLGSASERIGVSQEGEDIRMFFNARYLLEALGVMNSDAVEVQVSSPLSPGVFQPHGRDDFTHVLMPMAAP